jgi:hypothetical protein
LKNGHKFDGGDGVRELSSFCVGRVMQALLSSERTKEALKLVPSPLNGLSEEITAPPHGLRMVLTLLNDPDERLLRWLEKKLCHRGRPLAP